ncbi:hypothetical protein PIB30_056448 [Stylosanthes scabra]|uniref:Uncharacterized protein n=1 Tax=Stylosanthes scabra TaxID=79078 RepID=A0ABU6WHK3_9FABA|nr:hypothetical protein [Stylosanthes scabra]
MEKPTTNVKWRIQKNKVTSDGACSSSSNLETPLAENDGIDSPVRSLGSKKSKRMGKEKTKLFEDLSEMKSSIGKKLSLIEDFKIVREKKLLEEREHREKLIAVKENELQIQQEINKQELQTQKLIKEIEINAKGREMNMKILKEDTCLMSERRRALHEIACEKIVAKWFT